jgi:hypothetical protein
MPTNIPANQLEEWKDRWNHGDVKFVPELFELVENMMQAVEDWKEQTIKNRKYYKEYHERSIKQLQEQNRLLTEQLAKVDLLTPRQFIIAKDALDPKLQEDLKVQMSQGQIKPIPVTPEVGMNQEFLDKLQNEIISGLGVPPELLEKGDKDARD